VSLVDQRGNSTKSVGGEPARGNGVVHLGTAKNEFHGGLRRFFGTAKKRCLDRRPVDPVVSQMGAFQKKESLKGPAPFRTKDSRIGRGPGGRGTGIKGHPPHTDGMTIGG